jgi:hypothetical protein
MGWRPMRKVRGRIAIGDVIKTGDLGTPLFEIEVLGRTPPPQSPGAVQRDLAKKGNTVIEEKPYDREMAAADPRFAYHNHLEPICVVDVDEVTRKDISYGSSWKKRGGVGAFMMLARKWDRLEEMVKSKIYAEDRFSTGSTGFGYDIFAAIKSTGGGGEDGTVLAEVRDLRRYLLLVEAEMMQRGVVPAPAQEESTQ